MQVKLTEFGLTRPVDSAVRHTDLIGSYHGPELCEKVPNETFHVAKSTDVWALGKEAKEALAPSLAFSQVCWLPIV